MGAEELRGGVLTAIEQLGADLMMGRHGDPHVAFAVLVYPDREPAVIALTPAGSVDLTALGDCTDEEVEHPRFFTEGELREAQYAMNQALLGIVCAHGDRVGKLIGRFIEQGWTRQREYPIQRELAAATDAAKRPAVCPSCSRRFTDRGLPAHLRMNARCKARVESGVA